MPKRKRGPGAEAMRVAGRDVDVGKRSVWKGKARDEGSGGSSGVVLSLDMVGDGVWQVAYTLPVTIGSNNQQYPLQVDTGSSDLWLASTSCSTSACTSNKVPLYDPSSSTYTDQSFQIQYYRGSVSGPIVWDRVQVGGYSIDHQALSAASNVTDESLSPQFSGILGLALPLNSVIAHIIPPTESNQPDGAVFASNLFGISPSSEAPSQFFFSLSLERPGSQTIPSLLGIGMHPPELVPDASKIAYSQVLQEAQGTYWWKASVVAITVYVNGTAMPVDVGTGVMGTPYPTAVLDSGVPYILATPRLASGIWGALGINPASDGNYYVPCTTPLNMTITLDNRAEIPLHPLDLSAFPSDGSSSEMCVGLIQQSSILGTSDLDEDIVLGVPFLRSVYTVMAYEPPNANGVIGNTSASTTSTSTSTASSSSPTQGNMMGFDGIRPRLGLMSLTNSSTALNEFHSVRVLDQPLGGTSPVDNDLTSTHGKLSIGVEVLLGLLGFVFLCMSLFAARWFILRRKFQRGRAQGRGRDGMGDGDVKDGAAFALADLAVRRSHSAVPSEDTRKTMQSDHSKQSFLMVDSVDATFDSGRTMVNMADNELGYRHKRKEVESVYSGTFGDEFWDPAVLPVADMLAVEGLQQRPAHHRQESDSTIAVPPVTPTTATALLHAHNYPSERTITEEDMDADEEGGVDSDRESQIGMAVSGEDGDEDGDRERRIQESPIEEIPVDSSQIPLSSQQHAAHLHHHQHQPSHPPPSYPPQPHPHPHLHSPLQPPLRMNLDSIRDMRSTRAESLSDIEDRIFGRPRRARNISSVTYPYPGMAEGS